MAKPMWAMTIHDRQDGYLSFDTGDIVKLLVAVTPSSLWIVNLWDWEGPPDALEIPGLGPQAARGNQLENAVLTNAQLLSLCSKVSQTLDGEFVQIPSLPVSAVKVSELAWLGKFSENQAIAVVKALDADCFSVVTSRMDQVQTLKRHFRDVRDEDPEWFM